MPNDFQLIDPALCRLWPGNPRAARTLTDDACADLIDSLRTQGRQELPAIVRPLPQDDTHSYEIICGARRHHAVMHLRAAGMDIGFLVELRALSDEEAFRVADVENRTRADISDYDRAKSYAAALDTYYDGVQAHMAARMQVSTAWLSRHLQLARLPQEIVAAFADPGDIRERHARQIGHLLADPETAPDVLAAAAAITADGTALPAPQVVSRLRAAVCTAQRLPHGALQFRRSMHDAPITMQRRGKEVTLRFSPTLGEKALRGAFERFIAHTYG
ncbi:ParB/RepB/Spo0J family partition protein [Tateyamaria omphalii]|nr:ParB/RepB/Spo0J family partition protein [Tateyamaria omphalii]